MFAVFKAGGHQYRVQKGDEIEVDKLTGSEGDKVEFENVLMVGDSKGSPKVGSPFLSGAKVSAKIKKQARQPKILVFKYKRRKNYKRTKGHSQPVSLIEITGISG